MYLVLIAWIYVALMMAITEATHSQGSLLGAFLTFVLYGVGPAALVMYLLGAPGRRRAIKAREAAQSPLPPSAALPAAPQQRPPEPAACSVSPYSGSHSARAAEASLVAPVREEN